MFCQYCGSILSDSPEELIHFCPYCGEKLDDDLKEYPIEDPWAGSAPAELASIGRRLLATVIDGLIVGLIAGGIIVSDGSGSGASSWANEAFSFFLSAIYFIMPYSTDGQTWGKKRLGIKVAGIGGESLNWRKGILRYFGTFVSGGWFGLGYLWALFDRDNQTWHDKFAGTIVVRHSAEIHGARLRPEEARRRQRRWLLFLGLSSLLFSVVVTIVPLSSSLIALREVTEMGPWPGSTQSPESVVAVDLSHLGLAQAELKDPRDDAAYAEGNYQDGIVLTYERQGKPVVTIVGLRYEAGSTAEEDLATVVTWAEENCGEYSWANIGERGILRCRWVDADNKIFRNGGWIVDILALNGAQLEPGPLVDAVRDALAEHWKDLE